jgi:hypothetical protein
VTITTDAPELTLTLWRELRAAARAESLKLRTMCPFPTRRTEPRPARLTYTVELTCLRCAGELEHTTRAPSSGLMARAVAYCPRCRDSWLLVAELSSCSRAAQADRLGRDGAIHTEAQP